VDVIDRKTTSIRADQLVTYGNYELGIMEASKVDDEYSTKYFLDAMKKTPKSMKDMLLQLVKAAPTKKNSLRTIGVITSRK
jgi:TolA-binding protein